MTLNSTVVELMLMHGILIHGIFDTGAVEDARAMVSQVINENTKMRPPLSDQDVEPCHRLGHQTDQACPRTMVVWFNSKRMGDSVYGSTRNAHATRNTAHGAP